MAGYGETPRNRWNDAETTAFHHGRDGVQAAFAHGRPYRRAVSHWNSISGVARRRSTAVSRKWAVDGRTAVRAAVMAEYLPEVWHPSESNKGVSEGLSALGGKSIRVRRESPSKTPKNGSQTVPSPIALVGAIGEACGEASRVSVSGTPPFLGGASP